MVGRSLATIGLDNLQRRLDKRRNNNNMSFSGKSRNCTELCLKPIFFLIENGPKNVGPFMKKYPDHMVNNLKKL